MHSFTICADYVTKKYGYYLKEEVEGDEEIAVMASYEQIVNRDTDEDEDEEEVGEKMGIIDKVQNIKHKQG